MKISIGSDHGGYEIKTELVSILKSHSIEVIDYGTHSKDPCDYPEIAFTVANAVSEGRAERGILICKSGIGMAVTANKVPGIRAAVCYNVELAKSSREHNDCNILVFAANYTGIKEAKEILDIWLSTETLGDRHGRRVCQIADIEKNIKERKK